MCLALPVRVLQCLPNQLALVDCGGIQKEISIALVPFVAEGDYVILHAGYALAQLDEHEAQKNLALFQTMLREDV